MKMRSGAKALALLLGCLASTAAFGQNAPFAAGPNANGTGNSSLVPSTTTPANGAMFTVDVMVNITALVGTCAANPAVPAVFGGSTWEINFNSTNLTFNSAALCPTSPAELGAPTCSNPMAGTARCVSSNISGNATTAQSAP